MKKMSKRIDWLLDWLCKVCAISHIDRAYFLALINILILIPVIVIVLWAMDYVDWIVVHW